MTGREQVLATVRSNNVAHVSLPMVSAFHRLPKSEFRIRFTEALKRMAGEVVEEFPHDFATFVASRFPEAKRFCSAVPEYQGNCSPSQYANWSEAAEIDVTIVRSPLGVAETGSVLLSEREFQVNSIGFLAHDLVVLLDPNDIVENIHDAYAHPYFRETGYCLLMTGPSGSADISGVTVHPAQATMTLTVVFAPQQYRRP